MKKSKRPTYSPEFRLETAQLVVDQNYSQEEAAKAMNVAPSTISKWVKQLKQERRGVQVKQTPMTPEQIEIRDLKKRLERAELEKEILKKATALLMSDSMNNSR
jgi:transposase